MPQDDLKRPVSMFTERMASVIQSALFFKPVRHKHPPHLNHRKLLGYASDSPIALSDCLGDILLQITLVKLDIHTNTPHPMTVPIIPHDFFQPGRPNTAENWVKRRIAFEFQWIKIPLDESGVKMQVRTNLYSGESAASDLETAEQVRLRPDLQTALELLQTASQVANDSLTNPQALKLLMGLTPPADR